MTQRRVETTDTQALVERSRRGDELAFAKLVERYQHEVFNLAMRMVSNRSLAEDVAQEAFVRAWKSLDGFRGEAAFATWLHRITVNTALTHRQRRLRRATATLDQAPQLIDSATDGDPEAMGENLVLQDRLRQALADISPGQRQVVVLKDVEGWSHREIADALGITVSATKVRLHRARATLRQLLEDPS